MGYSFDRALDLEEAGELLGTGPGFVRHLITTRQLAAEEVNRGVRVRESALIAYLTGVSTHDSSAIEAERRGSV